MALIFIRSNMNHISTERETSSLLRVIVTHRWLLLFVLLSVVPRVTVKRMLVGRDRCTAVSFLTTEATEHPSIGEAISEVPRRHLPLAQLESGQALQRE